MNISHVLSLLNPQAMINSKTEEGPGYDLSTDSPLFSFLLSTLLGIKSEAKEQIPEEYLGVQSFPVWGSFLEEVIPGQAFYSQNLQEISPAGKDANSGLEGEPGSVFEKIAAAVAKGHLDYSLAEEILQAKMEALQSLNLTERQGRQDLLRELPSQDINKIQEPLISLKDFGLEGIKNPISREISSLNPMELEIYRRTMDLLREFSARIQLVTSGKQPTENSGRIAYPHPGLNEAVQEQSGLGQVSAGQGELKTADTKMFLVPGEGKNYSVLGEAGNHLPGAEIKNRQAVTAAKTPYAEKAVRTSPVETAVKNPQAEVEVKNISAATAQMNNQPEVFKAADKTDNYGEQGNNSGKKSGSGRNDVQQTEYQVITRTFSTAGNEAATRPVFVPAETNSLQIWEQVLNALKNQEPKEVKEMTIQLHPAELGKMHISARWENGQIHLLINASEQSAANILQNHLAELKNALYANGIPCGSLEMGYQDNKQQSSDREFIPERNAAALSISDEEKNFYPELYFNSPVNGTGSRINVRA